MNDNDTIAAILKAGKDIPVLVAGVDNTATSELVYPTREHPHLLKHGGKGHNTLSEAKLMTKNLSKIYRASSDYIGDASLTALQQQALKTKSLCLPLLIHKHGP